MLACAILVANNLRDLPRDAEAGKRTLAVQLGDANTRELYSCLLLLPFIVPVALYGHGWTWGLLALGRSPSPCTSTGSCAPAPAVRSSCRC